jgi:hypothetical protein
MRRGDASPAASLSKDRRGSEWPRIFQRVSLAEALELLETAPHFQPR